MIDARNGIVPEIGDNDPNYENKNGETVAMILAKNKIIPPKQWYHKPDLQGKDNYTTAMYIADNCKCIPDECWNHDPSL